MNLELELQALNQVWNGFDSTVNILDVLTQVLESDRKRKKTWTGNGRQAFDELEEQLKRCAADCSFRLRDSANALARSMNLYGDLEAEMKQQNKSLDAENIF